MEHTKTTFKHPGDLDSEIWEWLKEHGTEETKQIIMMTARHFYEFGKSIQYQQDRAEFAKLKAKEWQAGFYDGYTKGISARKEE